MIKLERTKNASRNIFFGIILKLYQTIAPFIMRTVIIYCLGVEYLGLNGLFASILQVLNLAELGVGSAMVYSMYKPIAQDDKSLICALLKLYKIYYRIIGTVIAVAGIALLPFIPKLVTGSVPVGINLKYLFLLHLGTTVLTYWLLAYKSSILNAHQRTDVISKITIVSNTLQYVLQFIILLLLKNYYVYLIVALAVQAGTNIVSAIVADRLYPHYKAQGELEQVKRKEINQRIKDLFTAKIGGTLVNSADTIVISAFLGLTTLAIYQNYYYIMTSVIGIVSVIFNSCTAGIGNSLVTESVDKNYNDFRKLTFIICWISAICVSCFASMYQPFMEVWVGRDYMFNMSIVALFCIYFYLYIINSVPVVYKEAGGIWHEDRFRPLVGALVNLGINLLFVKKYGVYAILLSTIISYLVVAMPWLIHNVFSVLFKRTSKNYVIELFVYAGVTTAVTVLSYIICSFVPFNGLIKVICNCVICLVLTNVLLFIIYRKHEMLKPTIDLVDNVTKHRFSRILQIVMKLI